MPRATVDINQHQRYDLKSCPGGFVVLRRMNYGEFLQRREMAMQMKMTSEGKSKNSATEMDLSMAQTKVAQFEFRNCIVEHNLEDHAGTLLDFRQAWTLSQLDPRIGEEIGELIDKMHQFDDAEDVQGNSPSESVE